MMKSFFKIFFASFLALFIFSVIAFFISLVFVIALTRPVKPEIETNSVLVLDLSDNFKEQSQSNPLASFTGNGDTYSPGLYDVVRMLHYAKYDSNIKGLYLKVENNANGFASSEELRQAILDFKSSKKFVIAYGETISEKAYFVATVADKIYCNPTGGLEFNGFSSDLYFMKSLLDKLEIDLQIFYAGKFKSATEPLRVTQMTDANRLQTSVWLGDLYNNFLVQTSAARNVDTATLHNLANTGAIQTAQDALSSKLVDALEYDDEVKSEILELSGKKESNIINFVSLADYAKAADFRQSGNNKIALIYAQGDIVGGDGKDDEIGSSNYVRLIRDARLDDNVKAIVLRVNSPGGSALASDVIWREISLAKKDKPIIVSMGDVAASGGYFISCDADEVYADATTITGSIGVFSIVPNLQSFFKDKLGVTFDGAKTAPFADMGNAGRPLTAQEKMFMQSGVDSIYHTFKSRVAEGRNKDIDYIDSIAQGRVWTGERAIGVGLVDKIGTLSDAVKEAAKLAKINSYSIKEYPEPKGLLEQLRDDGITKSIKENAVEEQIGKQQYSLLIKMKNVQEMFGIPQAKLPFDFDIH
jgi:protease IV